MKATYSIYGYLSIPTGIFGVFLAIGLAGIEITSYVQVHFIPLAYRRGRNAIWSRSWLIHYPCLVLVFPVLQEMASASRSHPFLSPKTIIIKELIKDIFLNQ